ncbi:MAG: maleylpyruvate isomerase family mycothiol-dependent enzyme [Streptosporangiales bacterium]|nr:maleylpyruvate isomerase family mycothiol-dependent enzyme [Streptosporangiales bacterium]
MNCHRFTQDAYCDGVAAEVALLAGLTKDADPATPVPSCPKWPVSELLVHTGWVHRWAAGMVAKVAPARLDIEREELDLPDHPADHPVWLAAGGEALVDTLRRADPEAPMWAWGADQHARFWPRRMLHETTVHRVDAQLALGLAPTVDTAVAVDGVDEFLENLPCARWAPHRKELRGNGESLALVAADAGVRWLIRLERDRFTWAHLEEPGAVTAEGAVTVEGAAADLYLLMWGRWRPDDERFAVAGDRKVLDHWAAHSAI